MTTLWLDFETYNETKDISAGAYEYARTCEPLLLVYAIDESPVTLIDFAQGERPSVDFEFALRDCATVIAHNAMFDRRVMAETQPYCPSVERWRCSMVKALAHGFPGSLDQLGGILGLPADQQKLKRGKALIQRFCKPAPRNHKTRRYGPDTHPDEWQDFREYAVRDVETMREVWKRLPSWNYRGMETDLYHRDQRINDRGFRVDLDLVSAGERAAKAEADRLAARFAELTGGAVAKPTERERFRQYLNDAHGLGLDDTRANTLRARLAQDGLPGDVRELLEISIAGNKTSTAKYAALGPATSPDGRFRGGLQFDGAARTRRWSGRTYQPQNLPSRGLPPGADVDCYIEALKADAHDLLFDDLTLYGSAALRGCVIAPDGKRLVVSDLSNIEGRVNAWLAGETWKLRAFREFDRGEGPDLYNVTAGSFLGKTPDAIGKKDRNVWGKVPELALGYEGGVGAFQTFAKVYGIQMRDHFDTIRANLDPAFLERAEYNYGKWGRERNPDLDPDEWLASETVKLAWRDRHPAIAALWSACKDAAAQAINAPGTTWNAGSFLQFRYLENHGLNYLLMRLPSGRFCCYFEPETHDDGAITYYGVDALTKQWTPQNAYGGKFVENACQSVARDVLADNLAAIEGAGFAVVLTVHDEVVTECDADRADVARLSALLATNPPWAEGLPLAAAGFVTDRYKKED